MKRIKLTDFKKDVDKYLKTLPIIIVYRGKDIAVIKKPEKGNYFKF